MVRMVGSCLCRNVMTQDKISAMITKWVKTDTKTVMQSGGSGLLVKSTEFQVYHLESRQAQLQERFFTLLRVRRKHVESC